MADTFYCRSVLLCDEIREEVGGKQFIIGAYAGAILLPFVPFYVARLMIRFEIRVNTGNFDHAECTILRPNSSILHHDTKPLVVRFVRYPTTLVFDLSGISFEQTGEHAVLLAMDSAPERVTTFSIVTRETIPQDA
jgi:hypothetical protein